MFFVICTTLETEIKRKNTSKLLSNFQLLSNLFIIFLDLTIISTMFIFIDFIYVGTHKFQIFQHTNYRIGKLFTGQCCVPFSQF